MVLHPALDPPRLALAAWAWLGVLLALAGLAVLFRVTTSDPGLLPRGGARTNGLCAETQAGPGHGFALHYSLQVPACCICINPHASLHWDAHASAVSHTALLPRKSAHLPAFHVKSCSCKAHRVTGAGERARAAQPGRARGGSELARLAGAEGGSVVPGACHGRQAVLP